MASSRKTSPFSPKLLLELRELVVKAKRGDASVLPRLRQFFAQAPELWQHVGDLARQSQAGWIKLAAGSDKHLQESICQKVSALKMELADPSTPPLERLLVERVISSWLQLYYHELREAQQPADSVKLAEFRLKQLTSAQDRHIKAIAALATLKRVLPSRGPASPVLTVSSSAGSCPPPSAVDNPQEGAVIPNGDPHAGNRHFFNRLASFFDLPEQVTAE